MRVVIMLAVVASLASCSRISQSRINPLNWFGTGSASTGTVAPADVPPLIPNRASRTVQTVDQRALMEHVSRLEVNRVDGGILITAVGQPQRAGGFNLQLVPNGLDGSTLTLDFRLSYPQTATGGRNSALTVSTFLSGDQIAGITKVRVRGAQNAITQRR